MAASTAAATNESTNRFLNGIEWIMKPMKILSPLVAVYKLQNWRKSGRHAGC